MQFIVQLARQVFEAWLPARYRQAVRAEDKAVSREALLEMRKWLQSARQDDCLVIERAPGFRLVEVLKFFCRRKTLENLIEPMHAEFLVEYFKALRGGQPLKAAYVKAQMHFFLVYAVISERVFKALGRMFRVG